MGLHTASRPVARRPHAAKLLAVLDTAKMRTLRTRAGLSMEDAAKAAKMPNRQQWYAIESGRKADVRISTLNKIAAALGVKSRDLLK